MADRRRELGAFAVLSLVLLRLATGWHFFHEGSEKVAYDATDQRYRVAFSAEPFLYQAKGPLAGWFRDQVPDVHGWSELLAVPRQNRPPNAEEAVRQAQWSTDYKRQRDQAEQRGEPVPIEFPPFAPYFGWAQQISDDWKTTLSKVTAIPGLSDEQRSQAAGTLAARKQQLADFLAGESEAIAEYQHELWRLENWQTEPEADGLPFQQQRIAAKSAETAAMARPWVNQVRELDDALRADLRDVSTPEQPARAEMVTAIDSAVTNPQQRRLDTINMAVTVLTIGVGICLLLGFFTRTASLAGALFLLGVIASQPPWVPGTESTFYQTVELAGLLVLAGTGAGRWLGLDFFTYALFSRFRRDHS